MRFLNSGFVVGLADKPSDGSGFEIGVNRGVDLDEIIVGSEGLHKRPEAEMWLVVGHRKSVASFLGHGVL